METKIIEISTLHIPANYGDKPEQSKYAEEWGNSELFVHIQVPEELDPECVKAVKEDNKIILVEDNTLTLAKIAREAANKKEQIIQLELKIGAGEKHSFDMSEEKLKLAELIEQNG